MIRNCFIAIFIFTVSGQPGPAQSRDRAADGVCSATIRVGLREDAPPFSFRINPEARAPDLSASCGYEEEGLLGGYAGYTVGLCRDYLLDLLSRCRGAGPQVEAVPVAVDKRHDALAADAPPFDMLCGATTATVTLAASVPHSPYTFLTSTSALVNARFAQAEGTSCRVGVVNGTTSAPGMQDRVLDPRRIETWQEFIRRNKSCSLDGLERAVGFDSTAEAILALRAPGPEGIDVLVGDHHILAWYWQHLDKLHRRMVLPEAIAARFEALDDSETESTASSLARFKDELRLIPAAISIEPYAVVAPPGKAALIADFSRFLTARQQDRNGEYTRRLRQCFGRQVDRSLWFLMEFQSKVRDGNPLK
ncbi:type 2 periplasmic-binding domain-containing protein [Rhodovulum sulfidophilum]|uniref:transporter substrate-binding domain-containing protein n=1 Tax=Rhodovulum sulfidophilum TaxID=35806 RepID=UPI001F237581|nr:transporter substrate-binding domain-containing protein [Rhodovulum sulfidophilum]MCE8440024.1 transporter substrate-binding domain-containing protein [Rhodovulum sulfidophilum]